MMPETSTMVDARDDVGGIGGLANGVAIGSLLWNGIFLGCSALGVMPPELAWIGIKTTYALAGFWFLAMFGIGARW